MAEKRPESSCTHQAGCGCTPRLFTDMVERAGLELSRRDFVKDVSLAAGLLASGVLTMACSDDHVESTAKEVTSTEAGPIEADAIYFGGSILTMAAEGERAEALAVKDGKILAAGAAAEVMALKGASTRMVDLAGKCLMPGFVDPHSHVVMQSAKFSVANLDPKPIGEAGSIGDIQRILRKWIDENQLEPGRWVIGWGYDDTGIEERRHPNRDDLDAVSTEHPILLMHISSHLMTGNSKMLEECGITADTADPDGGRIQRKPGSKVPNGVLEEMGMVLVVAKLPMPTPEKAMAMMEEGLAFYAAAGITTAQDCASGKGTIKLLQAMEQQGRLPIDVIAWPLYKGVDDELFEQIVAGRNSRSRLRLGGVKMTLDGSIQGYTAYLSRPYHVPPGGVAQPTADKCVSENAEHMFVSSDNDPADSQSARTEEEGHRGYPNMTRKEIEYWLKRCDGADVQIQAHTNGDGATDMLVEAVANVRGDRPRPDLRTTIIHAQTMRNDQLDFSAQHGLTPSFFPIHVYFWGDRHVDLFLGPERAARIDPARSALDRGLTITLHHDAPIAGIEMLKVAWSAINRVTTGGELLGPEQRITPYEALRAITADAAWQNFEEDRKGTLEAGKLADMIVLTHDPMAVDPMKIIDIQVLETIKEGVSIYAA